VTTICKAVAFYARQRARSLSVMHERYALYYTAEMYASTAIGDPRRAADCAIEATLHAAKAAAFRVVGGGAS